MQVVWVVVAELRGRVCIFKHSEIGCEVRRPGMYQADLKKDLSYCRWLWGKLFFGEAFRERLCLRCCYRPGLLS